MQESSEAAQQQVLGSVQLSPNRLVLLTTCAVYMLALTVTFLFVREIQITSPSSTNLSLNVMDLEMSDLAATNHPNPNSSPAATSSSSHSSLVKGGGSEPYLVPEYSSPTPSALSFQSPMHPNRRYISEAPEPSQIQIQQPQPQEGGLVCEEFRPQSQSMCETALQMSRSPTFWRFCLLSLLLVRKKCS